MNARTHYGATRLCALADLRPALLRGGAEPYRPPGAERAQAHAAASGAPFICGAAFAAQIPRRYGPRP